MEEIILELTETNFKTIFERETYTFCMMRNIGLLYPRAGVELHNLSRYERLPENEIACSNSLDGNENEEQVLI